MNPMGCLFLFAEQATPTTSVNRTVGVIVWVGLIVFSIAYKWEFTIALYL